ncbi:Aste57867_10835 [Aphanomyces stellatus]|uniref:Aste57867_10835 protein n=1 Tax=Aphanomyces stellatus TaxID=120398 RepID=A0A485KT16_9STRA|nr:hypothetical protein As57867_010795 [Aphanomyces stellatus]VFT87703.1 Aste57867_10835 [Aphanomyces stellatus]
MDFSQSGENERRNARSERTKEWECQMCTLLNSYKRKTCAACLSARATPSSDILSQSQSAPSTQTRKRLRLSKAGVSNVKVLANTHSEEEDRDVPWMADEKPKVSKSPPGSSLDPNDQGLKEESENIKKNIYLAPVDEFKTLDPHVGSTAGNKVNEDIVPESPDNSRVAVPTKAIGFNTSIPGKEQSKKRSLSAISTITSLPISNDEANHLEEVIVNPVGAKLLPAKVSQPTKQNKPSQDIKSLELNSKASRDGAKRQKKSPLKDIVQTSKSPSRSLPSAPTTHNEAPSSVHTQSISSSSLALSQPKRPVGCFFYHVVEQISNEPRHQRLKRRVVSQQCEGTHSATSSLSEINSGMTAADLINAKWLTSNMQKQNVRANLACSSEKNPRIIQDQDNEKVVKVLSQMSSTAVPAPIHAAAETYPIKNENTTAVFDPVNIEQEVEAPSFQLLNFAQIPVVQGQPRQNTEEPNEPNSPELDTSTQSREFERPEFGGGSENISPPRDIFESQRFENETENIQRSPPTFQLIALENGEYETSALIPRHSNDEVETIDDIAPNFQLLPSAQGSKNSLPPQVIKHGDRTTSMPTFQPLPLQEPLDTISQFQPQSQSSTYNGSNFGAPNVREKNVAMHQAGLDDDDSDDEFSPRKLRHGKPPIARRVQLDENSDEELIAKKLPHSYIPIAYEDELEWTCKWCTYLNDDNATTECECCGQAKGSSMGQGKVASRVQPQVPEATKRYSEMSSESDDEIGDEAASRSWICNMCTYENHKNPAKCELCDTAKGSNAASQQLLEEYNHFDGGMDEEFEIYSDDDKVVDLTSNRPLQKSIYESDSIEEVSDTEVHFSNGPSEVPFELREFKSFIPVASLRSQPDSIDYLNMFGANRGGKSYSDRLRNRVAESRRRKSAEARGAPPTKVSKGKRKGKSTKRHRKSPKKQKKAAAATDSADRSLSQFRKASSAKGPAQTGPRLLNANLQPKQRTKSMWVATDEGGDFGGGFRSSRYAHNDAPVEASRMATWEGHGSMRYDDD